MDHQSAQMTRRQIHDLFHPRSVAVVGAPRGSKIGGVFLQGLLEGGFAGPIYPIHPEAREIQGLPAYRTVSEVPGPVDLAIVLVPHHRVLPVIEDCARKGVKGAVLFTAGYRETGTQEGRALEDEVVRTARASGMRIIGPNCMGLYCPRSGLSFFPSLSSDAGPVGLISHSGSLANILGRSAQARGIRFSKVVSLGNESDLVSADFLDYLGADEETGLIGAYLEGIKRGRWFLDALRDATLSKPVILWKQGLTPEGERAASSHTGALAGSGEIWAGVVRQGGAVAVSGYEEWVDALMGFSLLPRRPMDRVAILSGPGGLAVSAAEACGREGLRLPRLSPQTQETLSRFVPKTGTSLRNPVDVGLTASLDVEIYIRAAQELTRDPQVDAVVVIGIGLSPRSNERLVEGLVSVHEESKAAVALVGIPGFPSELAQRLCLSGVPFFETAERAMRTLAHIHRDALRCRHRAGKEEQYEPQRRIGQRVLT